MTRGSDYDMAAIIQAAINPLMSEMQALKGKVDSLSVDRVTRSDLENVRKEIVGSFVPRDSYEPRHASLIEQHARLEEAIRLLRKDVEADQQKLHERLESGKQQIEERFKEQHEAQLSDQDRQWVRLSQWIGVIAILITLLEFITQHVRFN